jgi:hypothetical protein
VVGASRTSIFQKVLSFFEYVTSTKTDPRTHNGNLDSSASPGVLDLFNNRVETADVEFDAVFELYDDIACKSQCTIYSLFSDLAATGREWSLGPGCYVHVRVCNVTVTPVTIRRFSNFIFISIMKSNFQISTHTTTIYLTHHNQPFSCFVRSACIQSPTTAAVEVLLFLIHSSYITTW